MSPSDAGIGWLPGRGFISGHKLKWAWDEAGRLFHVHQMAVYAVDGVGTAARTLIMTSDSRADPEEWGGEASRLGSLLGRAWEDKGRLTDPWGFVRLQGITGTC